MIGDHFSEKWQQPEYQKFNNPTEVTRLEFEALKKEVLEMKGLLAKAKLYDEKNGEPDCEIDAKIAMLRKIAEIVGVNLGDILNKK